MPSRITKYSLLIAVFILALLISVFLFAIYYPGSSVSLQPFILTIISFTTATLINLTIEFAKKLGNIPILKINYEADRRSKLYNHVDVPFYAIIDESGRRSLEKTGTGNYILVGLENVGNRLARNCYVVLSLYEDMHFSSPMDNPGMLYWELDPHAEPPPQPLGPPSLYSLPPKDQRYFTVCHIYRESNKQSNMFLFDDYSSRKSLRRMNIIRERLSKTSTFYIKIVAYSDNTDPVERYYKITGTGNYEQLKMTECNP